MPEEAAERYMEWLDREEERLGIGRVQRSLADIDELKELLTEELGYEPTEAQVGTFTEMGKARYEIMPEVGVTSYRYERPWGYQMFYRDIPTGKFISYATVTERIKGAWAEWGY